MRKKGERKKTGNRLSSRSHGGERGRRGGGERGVSVPPWVPIVKDKLHGLFLFPAAYFPKNQDTRYK